jgi:septal ring factor EnvC (AmiA/AmiB activator)
VEDNEQKHRATLLLGEIKQNEELLGTYKEELNIVEDGLRETRQSVADRTGQLHELVKTIADLEQQIEHMNDVRLITIIFSS